MITATFETSQKLRNLGCEIRGEYGWYEALDTQQMIALPHRDAHNTRFRFVCEAPFMDLLLQWLESYLEEEIVLKLSTNCIEITCPSKQISQKLTRSFNDVEDVGQIIIRIVESFQKV